MMGFGLQTNPCGRGKTSMGRSQRGDGNPLFAFNNAEAVDKVDSLSPGSKRTGAFSFAALIAADNGMTKTQSLRNRQNRKPKETICIGRDSTCKRKRWS